MKGALGRTTILFCIAAFAAIAAGSVHAQTADTSPPTSPTNVTASLSQYDRVSVSWQASKDNVKVAGYSAYRNGVLATSTAGTGFWEYVTPGNTYSYTVVAYDTSGNASYPSAPSAPLSVPIDTTPPSTPKWLTVTPATSSIKLSWAAATDNIGVYYYALYRNSSPNPVTSTLIKTTAYTDMGLTPGTKYHYALVAYDYALNVSQPNTIDVSTVSDITPPTVPTSLSATPVSYKEIDLSWNASFDSAGVAGYYVYRNGSKIATASSTSYANTGLQGGTSYLYSVAAFDAAGNVSAKTLAVQATTLAPDTTSPSIPGNFAAKAVSASEIDLTWTASTDNVGVAGYYLYRGTAQIATIASSATSYADKRLATSTTYQYAIKAYDAAMNKSAITTVAATTLSYTPAAPSPSPSSSPSSPNTSSAGASSHAGSGSNSAATQSGSAGSSGAGAGNAGSAPQGISTTSSAALHLEGTPVATYQPGGDNSSSSSGTSSSGAPSSVGGSSFFGTILNGFSAFWGWLTRLL